MIKSCAAWVMLTNPSVFSLRNRSILGTLMLEFALKTKLFPSKIKCELQPSSISRAIVKS